MTAEQATEKIAKRISKEQTGSEGMWELFLTQAYREYYNLESKQNLSEVDDGKSI